MRLPSVLTAGIAAATVFSSPSAQATIRLADDRGGLIAAYQYRFTRARAAHEHIVIDGSCLSACTLAVGLVPREQVCATPKAVLGFHAAWQPTPWGKAPHPAATKHMWDIYPAEVQAWITAHGGLTPKMIFLKGSELEALVPACSEADVAAARATHVAHRPGHTGVVARGPRFHHYPFHYARRMMMRPY